MFEKNAAELRNYLFEMGLPVVHEIFPFKPTADCRLIIDCMVLSRISEFDIIYLETSDMKNSTSNSIASTNITPCLVIAKIGNEYRLTVIDYSMPNNRSVAINGNIEHLKVLIDHLVKCTGDHWEINSKMVGLMKRMKEIRPPD